MGVMVLDGVKLYPVLPNHGARVHLGRGLRIRFGETITPVCGQPIEVGIGSRRVPAVEWDALHESLRCQRCVRTYEARPG
ncbi:hypothetical protein SEA_VALENTINIPUFF_93 [Microbacterium phage ValentiniPuff]|uniref:Uncharacterized protein n=1 Tax=Microbacterium phage ValentiniPuff TaxID=2315705 RepID=A0A386KQY9_9CAUD|nr:hypothetical protein SEA_VALENTINIPUFF_93 [Microbacterium phage ValentiniPuff]